MGIDLYCNDVTFYCSYSYWNTIRERIIMATLDYITNKFQKDSELYSEQNTDDENYIGEGSNYYIYKNMITDIITELKKPSLITNIIFKNTNLIEKFSKLTVNTANIDALNYFDIGGLYSLCNKSDCSGYYTSGNAVDIIELLNLIEPFVKKYDDIYFSIYDIEGKCNNRLYDLYKESALKNAKICIS